MPSLVADANLPSSASDQSTGRQGLSALSGWQGSTCPCDVPQPRPPATSPLTASSTQASQGTGTSTIVFSGNLPVNLNQTRFHPWPEPSQLSEPDQSPRGAAARKGVEDEGEAWGSPRRRGAVCCQSRQHQTKGHASRH